MANKLIQEISLQDKGYSSGIKEAIEAVEELGRQNGVTTQTVKNVSRELRMATKYAESLSVTYSQLSDEAKNTEWGKQLASEIEKAIQKAGELEDLRGDIRREIQNIASDTRVWDTATEGVEVFAGGLELAAGLAGTFADDEKTAVQMLNLASAAQGTLNTVTALGNALQKESNIMHAIGALQSKALATASTLEAAAKGKGVVATKAATIAQRAFNAVAKANPYVLLATAAVAAAGAVWGFVSMTNKSEYETKKAEEAEAAHKEELMLVSEWCDKTGRSLEGLEKIQKTQPSLWAKMTGEAKRYKKAQEEQEEANKKLGDAAGDVLGKFTLLQREWSKLNTVAEQTKFINENKTAFENLGLSINTVNDAYTAFVKNAPAVLNALQSIAEAEAYQDLYKEAIKDKAKNWDRRKKSRQTGDYYTKVTDDEKEYHQLTQPSEWIDAGLKVGEDYKAEYENEYSVLFELTKKGEEKINRYRENNAKKLNRSIEQSYQDAIDDYSKKLDEAEKKAAEAQKKLGSLVKTPTKGTTTSKPTDKENPLQTYNNTLKEIERKREEGLIDEQKEVEEKIDAINKYIDTLLENGDVTEADTKELERLKPVLKQLRQRLKNLEIAAEDQKIVKEANEEYAAEIEKLNRDREQGWITEEEYNQKYISAIEKLTDKYKSVTNVSNELIDSINKKQKELKNLSFEKNIKEFNVAVEALIDDFNRIVAGIPLGNEYFNQKREAQNKVSTKADEYNLLATASADWSSLEDDMETQLKWIQKNSNIAIQLGISNADINTILQIGEDLKMDTEEVNALMSAISKLDEKLKDTSATDFINLDDKQKQLDWLRDNIEKLPDYLDDTSVINKIRKMGSVSTLSAEQMNILDNAIAEVGENLQGDKWKKNWFAEFRNIVEENNDLLDDEVKKVHTLGDALDYVEKKNYAQKFLSYDRDAQKGMLASDITSGDMVLNITPNFKPENFDKFVKHLEEENITLGAELEPYNLDEIIAELSSLSITIEPEKFNELMTELNEIKNALELDVTNVTNEAKKFTNTVTPKNQLGDASNYSLNTTSYQKLNQDVSKYDVGKGPVVNFKNVDDTATLEQSLDRQLAKYEEMERILIEINEKNERLGANIDTREMESQMAELEKNIRSIHSQIQKDLTFQVKMEGLNTALDGLAGLASYGSSMATLADEFEAIGERGNEVSQAFEYFGLVIQTVQSTIEAVNTVMAIFNGIQDLFAAKTTASAVATGTLAGAETAQATEEAATIPAKVASAAANRTLEASLLDLAAAQIFAAHAAIPFAGVPTAAGFVATMMSTMATVATASQTLAMMANGGIVGGDAFHGDTTLIRANKGEMILNQHQQGNLFSILDGALGNQFNGGEVEFKLKGDNLVGLLKNHNKIKSKTGHALKL